MSQHQINLLPEHIIDQIKAGEVIERPANVLKELLENSIDAGSKNISIHIRDNGLELIQIEDDGIGIEFEQLPYAFLRHATSKINRFEDIYQLFSYGFRGEALASMSSIGKVSCHSETDLSAGHFIIEGAKVLAHSKSKRKGQTGTTLTVKELFFNTPARLKFVQSKTSEKNRMNKIISSFILTHPHISFSVKWDDEDKKIYSATNSQDKPKEKRIKQLFNLKKDSPIISIHREYENYSVEIYLNPNSSRGFSNKKQFIHINDRLITDKKLHSILVNTAYGIWTPGEQGDYSLHFSIPSDEVDVNVHPNKTLVKFFMPGKIFTLLSSSIKDYAKDHKIEKPANPFTYSNEQMSLDSMSDSSNYDLKPSQYESFQDHIQDHINSPHSLNFSEEYPKVEKLQNTLLYYQDAQTLWFLCVKSFSKFLLQNFSGEATPLLISEPFSLESQYDFVLEEMEKYGFELDRINPNTIVLRSQPSLYQQFNFQEIIDDIIKGLCLKKGFAASLNDVSLFKPSLHFLKAQIEKIGLVTLLENKIAAPLENKNILKYIKNYE